MYENLKSHSKIIVTGPQRAGTRIGAQIIANDTDHKYIDERDIVVDDCLLLEQRLSQKNIVIQAPGMMNEIERISKKYPEVLIVVMRRNVDDIIASQKRINWSEASEKHELKKYGKTEGIISKIKYDYLDSIKSNIKNLIEVEYHSLANHPLFIRKQDRKEFKWSQTK